MVAMSSLELVGDLAQLKQRLIVCLCVSPPVPMEDVHIVCFQLLATFSNSQDVQLRRGPMDTWMAWANEDPSKLSCKRTCNQF